MSCRLLSLAGLLRGCTTSLTSSSAGFVPCSLSFEATTAGRLLGSVLGVHGTRSLSTSLSQRDSSPQVPTDALVEEPPRTYKSLVDKDMWHEAWMYEDRFGTEEQPVVVPSLESERIIGVTDPDDDNLVVWGIVRENEPPRQFIENGEFYVLQRVPYVKKVGDVLEEIEDNKTSLPK